MSVSVPWSEPVTPVEPLEGSETLPPLKEGDRLTRDEFERRYDAMPHLKKAELIEGVVHVPSPVRVGHHGEPHFTFSGWLFAYRAKTPGIREADNASVRLEMGNMPQPDCLLFMIPESGGSAKVDEDDYVSGAPELVAEISGSTERFDLHGKLQAYERNGVQEYIVWRVPDRLVDWFVLRKAGYDKLEPAEDGILRSTVFPGLWLDPAALLRDDFDTLLSVLERGLGSREHTQFVARLKQARAEPAG